MRCSHCEKCCQDTEMELCSADVERLERHGYRKEDFSQTGADGITRLRNAGGRCFFYDRDKKRCREYSRRPLGCVLYPVNLTAEGGVTVDEDCPEADSLTKKEIKEKGQRLRRLLDTIDQEAKQSR
jgi:uncharacterized protein